MTSETDYQFVNGGTDNNANVTNVYDNYGNQSSSASASLNTNPSTSETWTYAWRGDQAVVSASHFDRDTADSTNNIYDTFQYYDGQGRLQRAVIDDASNRSVNFALTSDGDVLSRVQNDGTSNDPAEYHLYAEGVQVADYTNNENVQSQNFDYQTVSFASRCSPVPRTGCASRSPTTRFRPRPGAGGSGATRAAALRAARPGPAATIRSTPSPRGVGVNSRSAYTVQSGDTLQSIAQFEWGDSSLWYMIADANGLDAGASLAAGQSLIVPDKVTNVHNSASTFRPYDPADAMGNLSPTTPKPPKHNKCGAFGLVHCHPKKRRMAADCSGSRGASQ